MLFYSILPASQKSFSRAYFLKGTKSFSSTPTMTAIPLPQGKFWYLGRGVDIVTPDMLTATIRRDLSNVLNSVSFV